MNFILAFSFQHISDDNNSTTCRMLKTIPEIKKFFLNVLESCLQIEIVPRQSQLE